MATSSTTNEGAASINGAAPSAAKGGHKAKANSTVYGIAAGAEDQKYQNKYKELSKKVKEIELVRVYFL